MKKQRTNLPRDDFHLQVATTRALANYNSSRVALAIMLAITHTSPKRVLGHLRRLQREGDAMLASQDLLTPFDNARWSSRLIEYLRRISADRRALDRVIFRDFTGLPLHRAPRPPELTRQELDQVVRRNISRWLVTLSSYLDQVEALVEAQENSTRNT
jgi:hypothetical protein